MSAIGKNIKLLRKSRNLTQQELADILNVSSMTISYYENGERNPGINTIYALAKFFNVTSDYLIGLEQDEIISSPQLQIVRSLCYKLIKDISAFLEDISNNEEAKRW